MTVPASLAEKPRHVPQPIERVCAMSRHVVRVRSQLHLDAQRHGTQELIANAIDHRQRRCALMPRNAMWKYAQPPEQTLTKRTAWSGETKCRRHLLGAEPGAHRRQCAVYFNVAGGSSVPFGEFGNPNDA